MYPRMCPTVGRISAGKGTNYFLGRSSLAISFLILSQVEFAELLGVAFSTVNRWESGLYAPTIKAKRKLAPLFEKYNIILEEKEND